MNRWILVCVSLILIFPALVFAQSSGDINSTIQELQKKIADLQGQENSLSKQIGILDSKISLTTLKIAGTRTALDKLSSEIDELATEITRLDEQLTRRSLLVLKRIPESYKRQVSPQFGLLLFHQNFADVLSLIKYITKVERDDAHLLFQLKATQENYNERKELREEKKIEQEELKKQLEKETAELNRQKKEKQTLLTQTKNSETVYQQLLAQAFAEKQALERARVEAVPVGPVKKGDPIALVGNSGYPGCSTGAHLHFEVQQGGTWVNAESFLSPREVLDQQNGGRRTIGSGNWDWPLEGDIIVTQHYGQTPYSWRYTYSGGIHTGVDMVSNTSSVIRAPRDGTLYASSQTCGASSIIKIKYIDYGDGTTSFFLHVQ